MAQWGVWLCGVLWVVPCVVMLHWLSSRAAQTFSFDTTIFFPQEIPNLWHRTCPRIALTSAWDIQEMLILTSKQTFLEETQISTPPLCPCVPLYASSSPFISQLCKMVWFEMPPPSHQNSSFWILNFPFWGGFSVSVCCSAKSNFLPHTTVG